MPRTRLFTLQRPRLMLAALALASAAGGAAPGLLAATFPAGKLPPYIRKLTDTGERPDFSPDGKRILYVTRSGGDVEEIEIATGKIRRVSTFPRPADVGFFRALYLANGDYFLAGGPGRRQCVMYFLDRSLTRPLTVINRPIWEGPAISRRQLRLAWTPDHERILLADVVYERGVPRLAHEKVVLEEKELRSMPGPPGKGTVEPQNFVLPDESVLTFAKYNEGKLFTCEVFTLDLRNHALTNQSNAPGQYDEPEGIFPDGRYTLVESDAHIKKGINYLDLYRLRLDGTGRDLVRLTHFNDEPGYKASNPVVSDDGASIAFQEARVGEAAGVGRGLYLIDWKAAAKALGLE